MDHPGFPALPPARAGRLAGRRITLCVTGSIAAYKSAVVARQLVLQGADVQVVMTQAALEFVGLATFGGITGRPVVTSMWEQDAGGESHITLAAESDLILIAPATADVIARLAAGRADDTVGAIALCSTCPVLFAPAMHPAMWSHPATQRNVARLETDARTVRIGPNTGEVASGDTGLGRMADPEQIVGVVVQRLAVGDLQGQRIVVTAGPTVEDIDPVRFVANRSSGKMGFSIARQAAARGAQVTLVAGPVPLPTPEGVQRKDVRSAIAMRGAVWQALGPDLTHADALIMAAAVADYRPAEIHSSKLKRSTATLTLELTPNPDILTEVGHARRGERPLLIGFALETDSDDRVLENARQKLRDKRVDLVVANHAGDALERDDNRAAFVTEAHAEPLVKLSKSALAERILDWLARCLAGEG